MKWEQFALDLYVLLEKSHYDSEIESFSLFKLKLLDKTEAQFSAEADPNDRAAVKIFREYFEAKRNIIRTLCNLEVRVFYMEGERKRMATLSELLSIVSESNDGRNVEWWPTHFASIEECRTWVLERIRPLEDKMPRQGSM
jgi:hypothetical protein